MPSVHQAAYSALCLHYDLFTALQVDSVVPIFPEKAASTVINRSLRFAKLSMRGTQTRFD